MYPESGRVHPLVALSSTLAVLPPKEDQSPYGRKDRLRRSFPPRRRDDFLDSLDLVSLDTLAPVLSTLAEVSSPSRLSFPFVPPQEFALLRLCPLATLFVVCDRFPWHGRVRENVSVLTPCVGRSDRSSTSRSNAARLLRAADVCAMKEGACRQRKGQSRLRSL